MLTLYITLTCLFFAVIHYIRKFKEFRDSYNILPGETDIHPLLGTLHLFQGFGEEGLKHSFENSRKYKYFHRMWMGPFIPSITCYHPDILRKIIKSTSSKPRNLGVLKTTYDMGVGWLGEGLILTNGDRWNRNRRLLTHSFHFDILKKFMAVYNSCSVTLIKQIADLSTKGSSIDLQSLIHKFTFDVILQCAFSYKSNVQTETKPNKYLVTAEAIQKLWIKRVVNPLKQLEFVYRLLSEGRQFYSLCNIAHAEADAVIDKRIHDLNLNPDNQLNIKAKDFLDTLLSARDEDGCGLSRQEIRDEVDTFMFAGHDTTASAIMWTLVSLAGHPEAQEEVHQEVKAVLEGHDDVTWEDLSKFQYLTQVIKEALRLHSVVPFVDRVTTEDVTFNDYVIPRGTHTEIQIWMLHHNPHIWEDPYMFLPGRFHPDKVALMDPFQFMPFSAGARNCIGQNFAMNEIKVVIAQVIKRFVLHIDAERPIRHKATITMKAEDGAFVYAVERGKE